MRRFTVVLLSVLAATAPTAVLRTRYLKTESFGATPSDRTTGVVCLPRNDGGFVVASYSKHTLVDGYDVFLTAYAPNGARVWQRTIDGAPHSDAYVIAGARDANENFYLACSTVVAGVLRTHVAKVDSTGVLKYSINYDASGSNVANEPVEIITDGNGVAYVCGYALYSGTQAAFLSRIDANGAVGWTRRYTVVASQYTTPFGVALEPGGNILLTGSDLFSNKAFIRRYSPTGAIGTLAVQSSAAYTDIAASGNSIYLCGFYDTGNGTSPFVQKRSSALAVEWTRIANFTPNGQGEARQVRVDSAGYVDSVGSALNGGGYDSWATRISPSGTVQWNRLYNSGGNLEDRGLYLSLDGADELYLGGFSADAGSRQSYMIQKISPTGIIRWVKRYNWTGDNTMSCMAYNPFNGDVLGAGEYFNSLDRQRSMCLQQSAIAIGESFSATKNTLKQGTVATNDLHAGEGAYVLVTPAQHGTVALSATGSFDYTPATNYTGPDSFTYRITKSGVDPSTTATASITVQP